jgi:GNAT superfamily N-acetyltransferase
MKILVDTEIVLSLEPGCVNDFGIHTYSALSLQRLGRKPGCSLWVHPVSIDHVEMNYHGERGHGIQEHMAKYDLVASCSPESIFESGQVGVPKKGSSDHAENCLLAAVKADAVDFFVTERIALHRKARHLGLQTRVLFLGDAITLLEDLFGNTPMVRAEVERLPLSGLGNKDPIFWEDDLGDRLAQYREEGCDAIVVRLPGRSAIAGICILKREGRVLTVCLLHVVPPYPGGRYGELLLKALFDQALGNQDNEIRLLAHVGEKSLAAFGEPFGFKPADPENGLAGSGYYKSLAWDQDRAEKLSPFEFHRSFGPLAVSFHGNLSWVLPLGPSCHQALFPELEEQLSLFPEPGPHGNCIRKACLCHTSAKRLAPGDNLFIYRTRNGSGITAMGVVEETLVPSCPEEVVRFLGTRTVYTRAEIADWFRKPLLAIKFRCVREFAEPLRLAVLKKQGVLKGTPRGVTGIKKEGLVWLGETLELPLLLGMGA